MDISKEVIEKIISLAPPTIVLVNGIEYSTEQLYQVPEKRKPEVLPAFPAPEKIETIKTLTGLVAMLQAEECKHWPMMYVIVNGPDSVYVATQPREDATRASLFKAQAVLPTLTYGSFVDMESMIITLRSKFIATDESAALIKSISNIRGEVSAEHADDGVAQKVTMKAGIGQLGTGTIQPIQRLRPYRTFLDVEQPESEFLFRMQNGGKEGAPPQMALYESDGGMWRNKAAGNVAAYLTKALEGLPNITVIQ